MTFTFQYGSTLIKVFILFIIRAYNFTFQYGSTLIGNRRGYWDEGFKLYIPIWFYFNCFSFIMSLIVDFFTFQYGSTLIWTKNIHQRWTILYIPIWFYFNSLYESAYLQVYILYIPIWFYFNFLRSKSIHIQYFFTFQYGSTLIHNTDKNGAIFLSLHSNMVLL